MKNSILVLTFITAFLFSCIGCNSDDNSNGPLEEYPNDDLPGDTHINEAALKLLTNLKNNANQGNIMVGHQATTIAGVGWRLWQMPDHSDFKQISGKFPSVYGWEISPRPDNQNETYDYVSFDATFSEAKKAYNRGGVNVFNMHPYRLDNFGDMRDTTPGLVARLIPGGDLHNNYKQMLDKYVFELKKLKDINGNPIPFIFRPYHEANHNWFWWGTASCTDDQYKTFFRFTVEYMRSQGLNHMLVCYAPGYFQSQNTFFARYPGDDVVDILGFDGYYGNNNGHGTDWQTLKNHLNLLKTIGQNKNKVIAWAETGEQNLGTSNYFSQLHQAISEVNLNLSYLLFWVNYQESEYYVPYQNLNNNAVKQDFIQFIQNNKYQAEGENPNMYN